MYLFLDFNTFRRTSKREIILSSTEGDADLTGDQALFGPNFSSLNALSGPNNAINNFFGSQVNAGNLDTTGTFGTRNQSASTSTNISAGRQGWDITSIDISPYLTNSQVSAAIRLTTNGDAYMLNTVGLQININSPNIQATKSVNKSVAQLEIFSLIQLLSLTPGFFLPITLFL